MSFSGPATDLDVSVHEARRLAESGALLLDVREAFEWFDGHIAGARHLPLARVDAGSLPADRPIVVVCRSGNRSAVATQVLRAAGRDAVNMAGGVIAWASAGYPLVAGEDGVA